MAELKVKGFASKELKCDMVEYTFTFSKDGDSIAEAIANTNSELERFLTLMEEHGVKAKVFKMRDASSRSKYRASEEAHPYEAKRTIQLSLPLDAAVTNSTGIFYAQGVKTNVLFFTRGKADKHNTKEVWIYDLRNDMPSFGKTNPLKAEHFDDFVKCYADGDLSKRKETYSEENPNGRWRRFTIEDILARDKTSLDITWMKADSGTDDYTLAELLDMIKEKSNNIAKAVVELEALIGEVEE